MTAIVLFAHGSRDPLWHAPIEAVAQRIRQCAPQTPVSCAYLELTEPGLPAAVDTLRTQGHQHIRILPMFLGMGRHAREDLPRILDQLRRQYPELRLDCLPAAGESPALIACLADLALQHQ